VGLTALFIFLRLAFVAKAVIPLYFDSAQHYLTIKTLLANPALIWSSDVYYHLGFHIVAAFVTAASQVDVLHIMLILGQMILAVIPLSTYFLVRHATQSSPAALFAVLLAAFGWYMPAHAVDWGKYPALTSLSLIAFVASLAYLFFQYRKTLSSGNNLGLIAILVLSAIVSGLMHSRALVVEGILFLAWIIVTLWQRLPRPFQWLLFLAILSGIITEAILIRTKDVFGPLFDPYINKGFLISGIILFLSFFAQWKFPKLTFLIIVTVCLLLGSLFIPVKGITGYADLTLLDRPFVEMILFMPFSLLGGLGWAGLSQQFASRALRVGNVTLIGGQILGIVLLGVIFINTFFSYEVYPSGCCSIVGKDDLVALDWMDKDLPSDAHVLISSTQLMFMATEAFQGAVGADAGIWIQPLTGRTTFAIPYTSDFGQPATLDLLCKSGVTHIYVGEQGQTFDNTKIAPYVDWYKVLLAMPKVKIYEVIGCQ
jgi:hypothetical protein